MDDPTEPQPCDSPGCGFGHRHDPNPLPSFATVVTVAVLARHRRAAGAPVLRALRVAKRGYHGGDRYTVDQWVSYAVQQAAPELDLRLAHVVCNRSSSQGWEAGTGAAIPEEDHDGNAAAAANDDDVVTDEDEEEARAARQRQRQRQQMWWKLQPPPEYKATRRLFFFTALRSLRVGPCRLSPPATVSLPSLEALHLTRVSDKGDVVQRLISSCPRLADLTLDLCHTVAALSLVDRRLRRLALRCCHNLATVSIDASELQAFEYHGAAPDDSFLTVRGGGGGGLPTTASCKLHICGEEDPSPENELVKFRCFLRRFVREAPPPQCSLLEYMV